MIAFSPMDTLMHNKLAYVDYLLIACVAMLGMLAFAMNLRFMHGVVYGETEIDKVKRDYVKTEAIFDALETEDPVP